MHNAPYVLSRLAGLKAEDAFIDWGAMSGWGLGYNVYKKEWSKEQLDILGIDISYMPKIVKPWDIIGGLTEENAAFTGLPAGTPICGGAGDYNAVDDWLWTDRSKSGSRCSRYLCDVLCIYRWN